MSLITISRGSFSGGKAVAEAVAQRLGHPVFSREDLLLQAANEYGISEKELADSLERPPHFWQPMLGKRLAYVKCVTAVLMEHARHGNLVYHGYVGHLLLAGVSHVLRVRVIADMERRIRAAMEERKLDRDQAVAYIHRVDKQRSKWARGIYGINWDDPAQYDVILNLERLSVASACETIVRLSELEDFQPTEASRQSLEDLSLSCRVWAAMAKNPATRSACLEVTARAGDVVITGKVGSNQATRAITETAKQVEGVRTVRCEVGIGADWYW